MSHIILVVTLREAGKKVWRIVARLQILVRTVSRDISKLAETVKRWDMEDHWKQHPEKTECSDESILHCDSVLFLSLTASGIFKWAQTPQPNCQTLSAFLGILQPCYMTISKENSVKRVRGCNRVMLWTPDQHWSKICFSDKSRFVREANFGT